ncbi:MAG: PstS family phosphate ABC transporter substrate-binding protein [Methylophilaceae bacterium]|nr:PstS family phosphate ABC transporter substrate-binding protein [Methylophilaceae bacterium]
MKFSCLTLVLSLITFSTVQAAEKTVRADGSSTVYPITEAVAEEYQKAQKVKVTAGISGTGGGFRKFCRGDTDVQNASRPILKQEIVACQAMGISFIELPIAYDALTVVVNRNNSFLKSISIAELRKMWSPEAQGQIKTWQQVNKAWPDSPLKLFGAGSDSGTFDYFTEAVVGKAKSSRGDYTASEDDNVLVKGVESDKGALGYFGLAYYEANQQRLRAVPIVAETSSQAVMPSLETVMNGSYQPLSRPLFIYVNAKSANRPEVKAFVDFYLKAAPQLVLEAKYIPLTATEYQAVTQHWLSLKTGTGFMGMPEVGLKVQDILKRVN